MQLFTFFRQQDAQVLLQFLDAALIDRLAPRPEGFSDGERLIPGRPYPH